MRSQLTLLLLIGFPTAVFAQRAVIMPRDIDPGPVSSQVEYLTDVNGLLFFAATSTDGIAERRLWVSDSTEEGTVALEGNPGLGITANNPLNLASAGSVLFFSADGIDFTKVPQEFPFGRELWRADGRPEGTLMVKDIVPGPGGSGPANIIHVGNRVYFSARGPDNTGDELWWSDGIPQGVTRMAKDINPGPASSMGELARPVRFDGRVYFWADDGTHGFEMWTSDGTPETTTLLKDINDTAPATSSAPFDPDPTIVLGSVKYRPYDAAVSGGTLFFPADDGVHGVELWKTDGTPGGTQMVTDLNNAEGASSSPAWLIDLNGTLFFTANDGINGRELFMTNGFATGTRRVKDIFPNAPSSRNLQLHSHMVTRDDILYFAADDGVNGTALWRSDGTSDGTWLVADPSGDTNGFAPILKLAATGGSVYFVAERLGGGAEPWQLDGLDQVEEIEVNLGPGFSIPLIQSQRGIDMVGSGGRLYFPADDGEGERGEELWVTVAEVPIGFAPERVRFHNGAPPVPLFGSDFEVQVFSVPAVVQSERLFSYVYKITNHGPSHGAALMLDPLPGVALSFPPAPCFGAAGASIACPVALPAGSAMVINVLAEAPEVDATTLIFANPLVVALPGWDPDLTNNQASATTTVVPANPPAGADLSVVKTARTDPVVPGGPIEYEITIVNNGPGLATNVVLTDPLPAGVSFASASSQPADACTELGGIVTCTFSSLNSGALVRAQIVGLVPTEPGMVTNTASVAANEPDGNPSDNAYSVDTLVHDLWLAPEPERGLLAVAALAALGLLRRNQRGSRRAA